METLEDIIRELGDPKNKNYNPVLAIRIKSCLADLDVRRIKDLYEAERRFNAGLSNSLRSLIDKWQTICGIMDEQEIFKMAKEELINFKAHQGSTHEF